MKNIAFLSCSKLDGFVTDDHLLSQELESEGQFKVTTLSWDCDADWKKFDFVIIRTTWDYFERLNEFLTTLQKISQATRLMNGVDVVKWNSHKAYLSELEKKGVKIVPTYFFTYPAKVTIPPSWKGDSFIVKPAVSAGAYKTMVVSREGIEKHLTPGDWLLQPFLEEIKKGEISLHYFNRKFSHAILKVPKSGDFRVQEEHGGDIQAFRPDEKILKLGEDILNHIPFPLLYARVDLLPYQEGHALMELELIEPALYFRTDSRSPKNFHLALKELSKSLN